MKEYYTQTPVLLLVFWLSMGIVFAQKEKPPKEIDPADLEYFVGAKLVDEYKLPKKHRMHVYFYEPEDSVAAFYPAFAEDDSITEPPEKAKLWREYIKQQPIYLFVLKDKKDVSLRYYCLRGNPEAKRSNYPQMIQSIKPEGLDSLNLFVDDYSANIKRTYKSLKCGGSLFEHMARFQVEDGMQFINKQAPFLGYRVRVAPYEEFKNNVDFYVKGEFKF